jgi:ABC-type enterochelin transport system substrate-binding protein
MVCSKRAIVRGNQVGTLQGKRAAALVLVSTMAIVACGDNKSASKPNSTTSLPPYLTEIQAKFGVTREKMEQVLARNPAKIFGFDLDALQLVADRIGPDFSAIDAAVA